MTMMMRRFGLRAKTAPAMIRCCGTCGRVECSFDQGPGPYVSFAAAPGFSQAPKRTLGRPPSEVPENQVQCYVIPNVVTEEAEQALLRFSTPWFQRLPFADGHMDSLIHHFKEFYRPYDAMLQDDTLFDCDDGSCGHDGGISGQAVGGSGSILRETQREHEMELVRGALSTCRALAAEHLPHIPLANRVHFLQLHGDGFIRAHVDESRNSSGIVAGLALNTGRVMSLTNKRFPGARIDLLMAPRAMYMLCGAARHEWEHSVDWTEDDEEHLRRIRKSHVAEGSEVMFNGKSSGFRRGTRTAVIFRGVSPMELLMHKMGVQHRHS